MIKSLLKTLFIFFRTFVYAIKSYSPKTNIRILKRQWAQKTLADLGLELDIKKLEIADRKLILIGNHISYLDIIVLMAAHPDVVFLSKIEVARWPILGLAARRIGTLFVDRSSASSRADAKTQIARSIDQNLETVHLAGFPSGTTSLEESLPWKKGLFEIAQETNTRVQPFRITYTPLRKCAYIDDDQLFKSLMGLFVTPNKKVFLEWGPAFYVSDLKLQLEHTQLWTQRVSMSTTLISAAPNKTESPNYEDTPTFRPSYSFDVQ